MINKQGQTADTIHPLKKLLSNKFLTFASQYHKQQYYC